MLKKEMFVCTLCSAEFRHIPLGNGEEKYRDFPDEVKTDILELTSRILSQLKK